LLPQSIRSVGRHLLRSGVAVAVALPLSLPSVALAAPARAVAAPHVEVGAVGVELEAPPQKATAEATPAAEAAAPGKGSKKGQDAAEGEGGEAATDDAAAAGQAPAGDAGAEGDATAEEGSEASPAAADVPDPPAATTGSVSVGSTPAGARIRVDGTEHGLTPQVIELPPGEHTIVVDKPGFAEHRQTVVVEAGAEQPLALTLAALSTGKEGKGGKGSDGPDPGRGLKIGGAVVLGLSLAGVAAGVAMILIDEEAVAGCSGADLDFRGQCRERYDTLLGGIIGTAGAGLGVAGGLAMLIQGHRITVKARGGGKQASVGLSVRF